MRKKSPLGLLTLALLACSTELWVPDPGATISLETSGGVAGVHWGVTIDGERGRIVGGACERQLDCDWQPGDTLGSFDHADFEALSALFAEAGFLELERDYGVECCDQFQFTLRYTDRERQHSVTGSSERLPPAASDLVDAIMRFMEQHRRVGD